MDTTKTIQFSKYDDSSHHTDVCSSAFFKFGKSGLHLLFDVHKTLVLAWDSGASSTSSGSEYHVTYETTVREIVVWQNIRSSLCT